MPLFTTGVMVGLVETCQVTGMLAALGTISVMRVQMITRSLSGSPLATPCANGNASTSG